MSVSDAVNQRARHGGGWLSEADCDPDELRALVATHTDLADYPHADEVRHDVPIYQWPQLREAIERVESWGGPAATGRRALQGELVRAMADGPGIVVLAGAFEEPVVDRATDAFHAMIAEQRAGGGAAGDHFAEPGANDRVWNALEKLAVTAPEVFVEYYANDALATVSSAWLGPGYQVTSQVNQVNPGGAAQAAHRDYHLGFMDNPTAAAYPAHVHRLSPVLTLQGAVAHCDMPVESGPTLYLPHSQRMEAGYLAWRLPAFQDLFEAEHVQLPLAKGDAVFFNPALFHAAGANRSADIHRVANLLQVSSAFGRAMESVDRVRTAAAVYPALQQRRADGVPESALSHAIAAAADGYAFPTNLDRDTPVDGLAPASQADLVRRALAEETSADALEAELREAEARRHSHA